MPQTIHFNTGRLYTAAGQRITATLHDDGVVTFYDHDRSVDGELAWERGYAFSVLTVRAAYDSSGYKSTRRSWQDAFLIGGCNARYEAGA